MWSSNWSLLADWPALETPATEYSGLMVGFIVDEIVLGAGEYVEIIKLII